MDLTLERPGDHLFVRSVSAAGIQVGGRVYSGPLILAPGRLIDDWPVTSLAALDESVLRPILDLGPQILLLGTGPTQEFPDPALLAPLYHHQIGVEIMTTPAACRTFNVLASEHRNVVAALLPVNPRA